MMQQSIVSSNAMITLPLASATIPLISVFARPSKGVRVMKVKDGERVVTLTNIEHSEEESEENSEESNQENSEE